MFEESGIKEAINDQVVDAGCEGSKLVARLDVRLYIILGKIIRTF